MVLLGMPAGPLGLQLQQQPRLSSSSQCSTLGTCRPIARPPCTTAHGAGLPWSSLPRAPGKQQLTAKFRRRGGEAPSRGELQVVCGGPGGGMGGHGGGGGEPVRALR